MSRLVSNRPLHGLGLFLGIIAMPLVAQDKAPEPAQTQPSKIGKTATAPRSGLPSGTRIGFVTLEEISTKRVRKGDQVKLALRDDVFHEGTIILAAGTSAVGEVTRAEKKGMMGHGGKLSIRMLYIETSSGPMRVTGEILSANESQTGLATAVATASLGVVFFVTGKSAVVPAQTKVDVVLERDARIPAKLIQPQRD